MVYIQIVSTINPVIDHNIFMVNCRQFIFFFLLLIKKEVSLYYLLLYSYMSLWHITWHLQSPHVKMWKPYLYYCFYRPFSFFCYKNQVLEPMRLQMVLIILACRFAGVNPPWYTYHKNSFPEMKRHWNFVKTNVWYAVHYSTETKKLSCARVTWFYNKPLWTNSVSS